MVVRPRRPLPVSCGAVQCAFQHSVDRGAADTRDRTSRRDGDPVCMAHSSRITGTLLGKAHIARFGVDSVGGVVWVGDALRLPVSGLGLRCVRHHLEHRRAGHHHLRGMEGTATPGVWCGLRPHVAFGSLGVHLWLPLPWRTSVSGFRVRPSPHSFVSRSPGFCRVACPSEWRGKWMRHVSLKASLTSLAHLRCCLSSTSRRLGSVTPPHGCSIAPRMRHGPSPAAPSPAPSAPTALLAPARRSRATR